MKSVGSLLVACIRVGTCWAHTHSTGYAIFFREYCTLCFGLYGHLQVCRVCYFHMFEGFCFDAFFFCVKLTTHFQLVSKSRNSGTIPPLPPFAFIQFHYSTEMQAGTGWSCQMWKDVGGGETMKQQFESAVRAPLVCSPFRFIPHSPCAQ
jgi:hypothetical protein